MVDGCGRDESFLDQPGSEDDGRGSKLDKRRWNRLSLPPAETSGFGKHHGDDARVYDSKICSPRPDPRLRKRFRLDRPRFPSKLGDFGSPGSAHGCKEVVRRESFVVDVETIWRICVAWRSAAYAGNELWRCVSPRCFVRTWRLLRCSSSITHHKAVIAWLKGFGLSSTDALVRRHARAVSSVRAKSCEVAQQRSTRLTLLLGADGRSELKVRRLNPKRCDAECWTSVRLFACESARILGIWTMRRLDRRG